jgi:hypothetical protein
MKQILVLLFLALIANDAVAQSVKPMGAVQLIGTDGIQNLISEKTGEVLDWPFKDGVLTVNPGKSNHAITSMPLGDFKAHIEFRVNEKKGKWGNNGNSGVYIQQRYELQILNSFGRDKEYTFSDCGSIYKTKMPDAIVCRPAGEWQTYDIEFHQARWDGDKKIANARIRVIHNGVKIHDNFEIPAKTGHGKAETPSKMPLRLQDHSNKVEFRNFWIKEI